MFHIRRATTDDLEMLTSLRVALFEQTGELADETHAETFREATHTYLKRALSTEKLLAWVAETEGQIVGTGGLILFEQAPIPLNLTGLEGYILNMYTLPEWRGRGVATALLQEIITYARSINLRHLWLYATEAGRPVYEKVGFAPMMDEAMDLYLQ
jgi:GNAT superfamily N-acetyltransferase